MRRRTAALIACACAGLLGPGCVDLSRGPTMEAAYPRITDLSATPATVAAGDEVEITFTAWDAGGGIGGDWLAFVTEAPAVGGRLAPNGGAIGTSPVRCRTTYTAPAATRARIEVSVTAYGNCRGLLCIAPSNTQSATIEVVVLPR
jgi:hypothetical protein